MAFVLTPLPPLPHASPSHLSKVLPELRPLFFFPPLEDKPQNPIVDALVEVEPLHELDLYEDISEQRDGSEPGVDDEQDLWAEKRVFAERSTRHVNQNLSWDALRSTFPKHATATPFLSEQSNDVFDAVRHHVRPRLDDPSLQLRYILPAELLVLLAMNMVGNSSPLYVWDPHTERFVSNANAGAAERLVVIIEGLDEVASKSVIGRFLSVGVMMRRLEGLVSEVQRQNSNPTMHAFAHALSTVLVHIRDALTRRPPYPAAYLTSLWLHYGDTDAALSALAALCNRGEHESPPYTPLPDSPAALLSHVYTHLERHIEHRSPRRITALVAYILTTASRDYFKALGESLGLSRAPWLRTGALATHAHAGDIFQLEDGDVDFEQSSEESDEDAQAGDVPVFVPAELAEALPGARRSLAILRAADPEHPLCAVVAEEGCEWVWDAAEVEELWLCRARVDVSGSAEPEDDEDLPEVTPGTPSREYKTELEQLRLFDLEPGTHLATSTKSPRARATLKSFLASFPERLPALTPTLQHLATVVLQPLATRTAVLSRSLLRLYLTSLHLKTHLALLRSYMLLTLPAFKTRLVEALFSDDDQPRPVGRGVRARARARLGMLDARDVADAHGAGPGIGLGHGLAERDTWPPGGADLSFFLRTVIVDSLDERPGEGGDEEAEGVWREGEVRLGFALRDLPVGDGRERWLNPMSIEALDFLYLDYKPPHPLDVVITPNILSKYQRIFTFLLRLFRAETVGRIAFRSTFKSAGPVFPYAPQAQDLLVRLRFQIQAFVTSFVTYIFDSAIGGNFDAYMRRLAELRGDVEEETRVPDDDREITDVFSLEKSHSDLLDRMLSACLLRTAQRTAGDALRDLLELVLQFGMLVTSVRRGHVREAQGAAELQELYGLFQMQMISFAKALQALHAKNKTVSMEDTARMQGQAKGRSHLEDLLIRIDATGWWRRKGEGNDRRAV